MALIGQHYRVREVLSWCAQLQRMESRYEDWGASELMRMAVLGEPNEDTVIVLCRLLFRAPDGGSLRRPLRGEPAFIGDTTSADWSMEPVHLSRGMPFCVVTMYSLAGLAEPPPAYLAYCLRSGIWNADPYPEASDVKLRAAAEALIASGPWRRPLEECEQQVILGQIA